MKLAAALMLVCCLSLPGCGGTPPPIIGPAYQLDVKDGEPRPTRMVNPHDPHVCPSQIHDAVVHLAFTVEPDGGVSHIRVLDETPKACGFAGSAVYAFRSWRFPPYLENGVAVPYDAHYRVLFKLFCAEYGCLKVVE